jgi:hypothetical protein
MTSESSKHSSKCSEHYPLNFNSLLNKLKANEDKDTLMECLNHLKETPSKKNIPIIVEKYEELIDLSKITELNIEREAFYQTYKRKLGEYKNNSTHPKSQLEHKQDFLYRSAEHQRKLDDIPEMDIALDEDLIKQKSIDECKLICETARKEGQLEARLITANISKFRTQLSTPIRANISPMRLAAHNKMCAIPIENKFNTQIIKLKKVELPTISNNCTPIPYFSSSPQLKKRILFSDKMPSKGPTQKWLAKILH